MPNLENETKLTLYKVIQNSGLFDFLHHENILMDLLEAIWDLVSMPSTDPRFPNLKGDIFQHTVNNNDWDWDFLFLSKLLLLEDDDRFSMFIESVLYYSYRFSEKDTYSLIESLNEVLDSKDYELVIYSYKEDIPIYRINSKIGVSIGNDFPLNNIPFFVVKNPLGRSNRVASHNPPISYPSFVLVFNRGWNDFNVRTSFDLFFYKEKNECKHIGFLKLIHKTSMSLDVVNKDGYYSDHYLPDSFEVLTDSFCSLGQNAEYYENIRNCFPSNYLGILWALKDCAIFTKIEDDFSNHKQFHSLTRENEAERLLRIEKYILSGVDIKSRFQFSYKFTPKYSDEEIVIDFKFDKKKMFSDRIYAIIGKNGVGKTQMITALPWDIANKRNDFFNPNIPIYSKIIAVSNSYYDQFEIPKKTASFNYVYCGLSKLVKGEKEILTDAGMVKSLIDICKEIQRKDRVDSFKKNLLNILDKSILNDLLTDVDDSDSGTKMQIQFKNIKSVFNKLSSGQSILVYIFCNIIANIRFDSLLIFDEPETHLHPNAVTNLMNAVMELLEEYDSYCIISTHSPLIVRELLSRNVYVMERNGNYPSVRKIGLECFGENLTVLTDEIFGNNEVPKIYKNKLEELVFFGYSYEEIETQIRTDNVPLNLNLKIYIRSLIGNRDEKN